ncbi:MAG: hypothetical protein J7521_11810 [Caulobacter sp.]|nr:hypothetical protein [Caulobacter sp.]
MSSASTPPFTAALSAFASWLGKTPLYDAVAGVTWVVPTVQTLHILAIAVVFASAALIDLRILGLVDASKPIEALLTRFLRPVGAAVAILAVTGLLLIASEPSRAIFRVVFWVKLALVLAVSLATWWLGFAARRRGLAATEGGVATLDLKIIAALSLITWLAIIVAGRWIGYAVAWDGAPQ